MFVLTFNLKMLKKKKSNCVNVPVWQSGSMTRKQFKFSKEEMKKKFILKMFKFQNVSPFRW